LDAKSIEIFMGGGKNFSPREFNIAEIFLFEKIR
jgi:hypothetical protein